jgi:predicted enzyme related to lactoylglutathione lyase
VATAQRGAARASATGAVTRFGVADAGAERTRLARLGVTVGPLEQVPGAVDYFDFTDPDGNRLSLYSAATSASLS